MDPKWLQWARQIQAIAQTGLHFASSEYDRERYQQLQTIAIQIFGEYSDTDVSTIRAVFDREHGYATPKVDVRGVVFAEQKILLVKERSDGLWTLPGGWADVNDSPSEAAEKEIREESGYIAKADRLLALFDRTRHPHLPAFPFHVYKLFILCRLTGGEAKTSYETTDVGFFAKDQVPPLSISRVTAQQIQFCFNQLQNPNAPAVFD